MDQRELDYVDMRDLQARNDYINDSPEPAPGEPLLEERQAILVVPNPPRTRQPHQRTRQTNSDGKRHYVKVTIRQKTPLSVLFGEHGETKSSEWYSAQCGIPHHNTKTLLAMIRRGDSLLPRNHYRRKSRVLPFQHLVLRCISIDPTTPLKTMREDLGNVVLRHGDDVARLPANVIDEVVAERMGRASEARNDQGQQDREDMPEENETNEQGSETAEVVPVPDHNVSIPSVSALSRFLRGLTGTDVGREIPVITFKKCHVRGATANTDENKTRRLEAISELRDKMASGYWWVCIDETSWSVGNTTAFGWSKRGDPCFVTKSRGGIALTSISAIDMRGVAYCNLTTTTNTAETFNAYFRRLIAKYDEIGTRCVFWVDNCRIHNQMLDIVQGSRHCVVFNAAYSPELNPIENVFGIWKRYAERDVRVWTNLQDLLDKIAAAFSRIEPNFVTAAMERCRTDVWTKVVQMEDL